MCKDLYMLFEELEKLDFKISEIDKNIKELVPIFNDPEESCNPIVKEKLNVKNDYVAKYNYLFKKAKEFSIVTHRIIGLECDYFIKLFPDIQARLDYINEKIRDEIILDGTRELFTSLAYNSTVKSYSPFNVVYVAWKFPKLFNENVNILYNDEEPSPEECKKVLLESMNSMEDY